MSTIISRMKIANPEDIQVELTVKMSVRDWRIIDERLSSGEFYFHANEFSRQIRDCLRQICKVVTPEIPVTPDNED